MIRLSRHDSGFVPIWIVIAASVVLITSVGWYVWRKNQSTPPNVTTTTGANSQPQSKKDISTGNTSTNTEVSTPQSPTDATNDPVKPPAPAKYSAYPQGGTPTTKAQEWYSHAGNVVYNPSAINIFIEAKNIGSQSGAPTCTIKVQNDSGTNSGVAIVGRPTLEPGAVTDFNSIVTVSNEGAESVTQISVTCL